MEPFELIFPQNGFISEVKTDEENLFSPCFILG